MFSLADLQTCSIEETIDSAITKAKDRLEESQGPVVDSEFELVPKYQQLIATTGSQFKTQR
jgi:hypothetical protein